LNISYGRIRGDCIRKGTIYIIRNKVNEKVYIGLTTINVEERWEQHIRRSRDRSKNYKLYNAIRKYGLEQFYYEILECNIDGDSIGEKEIYYINHYDSFNNGYNSTRGADSGIFADFEEEGIIQRYINGESSGELANDLGVSWRTIIRVLEKHNIERRDNIKIHNDKEFTNDYILGIPLKDMAEKYNVDIKTISRKRNKLNLPKRKSS
jgi:group I intron endonuclease